MAFPSGFLDELRARVSLADLVGRRVRLVRRGREHSGLCPFHNEKTPSFYVVEDKGFFHCFGCGAHGDAIGFVMRADNLDFIEAVERLAGEAGVAVPQQTPQERDRAQRQKTLLEALAAAAEFYEAQLWGPAGARAREYLIRRGLDEEAIRRFRLGWAAEDRQSLRRALAAGLQPTGLSRGDFPEALLREAGLLRVPDEGGTPYDYFRGRVMFPIGDRAGRVIAFGGRTLGDDQPKYLNSPDTPLFEKGRILYGWAAARAHVAREPGGKIPGGKIPGGAVIVVEGYMDVIALHRAGFGGAVAPLGTALTEMQLHELWRLAPEPVLCFDGDTAGRRAALRALARALPLLQPGRSLRFATLPPGEDPDSLLRAGGPDAFSQVLAAACPMSEMLWQSELNAGAIDTPERRADLERRLMAAAGTIADRTVQYEYRRFFRDRLFALGRSDKKGRPDGRRPAARTAAATANIAPPLPPLPGRRNREIVLGIFIAHPPMIDDWVEDLAAIDFPEPELDNLRRAILEVAHTGPGLDAQTLQQHLALCGHTQTLGALAIATASHAGFAMCRGDDPEVIRQGLKETLQLLQTNGRSEIEAASRAFAADPSAENARRLTALKERELQDGPIGGVES
ncbi:MAG TPA: DNA primase [Stellaceae bacterium]|nr:DNA primase [Stellaceae bacterium]